MIFPSIRIEGAILSSEILSTVAQGEVAGQLPVDFELAPTVRVKDEIARAWADALDYWRIYKRKLETSSGSATTETRKFWIIPLLNLLGYDPQLQARGQEIQGRLYSISHRDRGDFPIHIVGWRDKIDVKRSSATGPRLSPHGLLQEYLNLTDHTYGLVTNGSSLRLLRNNLRLGELWCVEFDLESMMDQEIFADFAVLFRLLHVSRLPASPDKSADCWLEKYHQDTLDAGSRIRDGLSLAVERAIAQLAKGFLAHPANDALRQQFIEGKLTEQEFYQNHLRLIYRILFLLVAEERDILYSRDANHTLRTIYEQYYSLIRLRRLADFPHLATAQYNDLWTSLLETFRLFEPGDFGKPLGLAPLGGTLFRYEAIGDLNDCILDNRTLLSCLRMLSVFESAEARQQIRVNYKDLDVQEFGSVYEGLLDLHPHVNTATVPWSFSFAAGTERKTTGSYYTRPELVRELVRSALEPVIADRLSPFRLPEQKAEAEKALLSIRVCDPAAGSGHMLIAAGRQLAMALAQVRTGEDQPGKEPFRTALRDTIQHCLYGVDLNPGAVELCQVALWMESHNPGKPLSFLDHKIKHGNSLVGVFDLNVLSEGIPDEAFNPVTGDDTTVAKLLKNQNKAYQKRGQLALNFQQMQARLQAQQKDFATAYEALGQLQQDSVEDTDQVQHRYQQARTGSWWTDWQACNLYTAAFFQTYTDEDSPENPSSERLARYLENPAAADGRLIGRANTLQIQHRFFHWPLEFPEVFASSNGVKGGFDVVIGNPPWERIKLQEQEYFSTRDQAIATAPNKAARDRLIRALPQTNPALLEEFTAALHTADAQSKFIRVAGRNPLTASGDINTYSIFAELDRNLLNPNGRAGVLLPTGIATDDNNKAFFGDLVTQNTLVSLFDFENREALFQGVHRSYKFCLLTMAGGPLPTGYEARFAFFLTNITQLQDPRRVFGLTAEDFARLNPNTRTCPIFRTRQDAELTAYIYRRVPVMINEETGQNPWGIRFMAMFHMSNDSHLFRTQEELLAQGFDLQGNRFVKEAGEEYLPLYESKFIWHYDHRYGTYEGCDSRNSTNNPTLDQYQNSDYVTQPWYWVRDEEIYLAVADVPKDLKQAYRQRDWTKLEKATEAWLNQYNIAQQAVTQYHQKHPDEPIRPISDFMIEYPLTGLEASRLSYLIERRSWEEVLVLLKERSPKWLIGWRDITNSTNERTMVSNYVPLSPTGDTLLLMFSSSSVLLKVCLGTNLNALTFDFATRQKIGGMHLKYHVTKQLPVLPPVYYTQKDLSYILPRALELTYTARDMQPYFDDIWAESDEPLRSLLVEQWQANHQVQNLVAGAEINKPFVWDEARRAVLQAELDAYYARLYGLSEQDLRYILDPQDVYGEDFPGETFRVLKDKDIRRYGEYRTKRLVLEAFAKLPASVGAHIPAEYVPRPAPTPVVAAPEAPKKAPAQVRKASAKKAPKPTSPPEQDLRLLTSPLFAAAARLEVQERSKVTIRSADENVTLRLIPVKGGQKGQILDTYQIIDFSGELAQALLGRREGQEVEFKGKAYKIVSVL